MGSETSSINEIPEYSKSGLSQHAFITELKRHHSIQFTKIMVCTDGTPNVKMTDLIGTVPSSVGSGVLGGLIGGALGALVGGPPGATVGYFTGAAVLAIPKFGGQAWNIVSTKVNSTQYYVLCEYGPKLPRISNGFTYAYYMRVEFTANGYSIHVGNASKYLKKFPETPVKLTDPDYEHVCCGTTNGVSSVIDEPKYHDPNEAHDTNHSRSLTFCFVVWRAARKL
eukprot:498275_1